MEIIAQYGGKLSDKFIVKYDSKHYVIKLKSQKIFPIETPDIVLRQGYWNEPNVSDELKNKIEDFMKTKAA